MPNPYTSRPGLTEIYLEDSYVLAIEARPGQLRFTLEFVLTPRHPDYRPPRQDEQHCYRRGELIFGGVTALRWTGQGSPPARDATGEIDYGNIDTYEWDAASDRLTGEWGRIEVTAASVSVELNPG